MKDYDDISPTTKQSEVKPSRRSFLKAAGATTVSAVALAGCSGGSDGGSGSSGGSTGSASGELTEVNMVMPGTGFQGMMMNHVLEEGILEEEMSERGYMMNLQETFEGAALFASGGPDFTTMSTFEAARLSAERDMNLASFGRVAPNFMGWWVEKGGEFDSQNTGSTQDSIEQLASGSGKVGIGSWAGGHVPPDAMIMDRVYDGYDFGEGKSDFNVVTANYGAIPQLTLQGDLAAGSTSPVHGVARQLDDNGEPELAQLFNAASILDRNDYGVPLLNSLTTNQQFIEENEGACTALLQTWTRGMEWLFSDPMGNIGSNQQENLEVLHLENMEQAQYLTDWGISLSLENEYPIVYQDVAWTGDTIEADKAFLSTAQDAGFIPEGYQDRLSWVELPAE
jgi:hypothetical protein